MTHMKNFFHWSMYVVYYVVSHDSLIESSSSTYVSPRGNHLGSSTSPPAKTRKPNADSGQEPTNPPKKKAEGEKKRLKGETRQDERRGEESRKKEAKTESGTFFIFAVVLLGE